jgi:hypothetical protein
MTVIRQAIRKPLTWWACVLWTIATVASETAAIVVYGPEIWNFMVAVAMAIPHGLIAIPHLIASLF